VRAGGVSTTGAVPAATEGVQPTVRDANGRLRGADGRFAKEPAKSGPAPSTAYDRSRVIGGEYNRNQPIVLESAPICQYCQGAPSTTVDHVVSGYEGDA